MAGSAFALVGLALLSFAVHWFQASLLILGIVTLAVGLMPGDNPQPSPAAPVEPAPVSLRDRLEELDRLKQEGLVSKAEHARKRREILDAWGK